MNTSFYKNGQLDVSDGHSVYYELYGNPKGKPLVFFHGGPGSGFSDKDKRFFDPKIWNVLFFDQRGSGRSTPFASLQHNTTQDLVSDTKKILRHVGFQKAFLFGGSWGATLALIFAIQNPKLVTGMILRGTFLANQDDFSHFLQGGVSSHFSDVWERFVSHVPPRKRNSIISFYLSQMQSDDPVTAEKYAYEWCFYEASLTRMKVDTKKVEKMLKHDSIYKSLSPLEAHYISHNCFIPENYILNNISEITHIPVSLIHGRYDFVCPPINSYTLHKKLPKSTLQIVTAGHSSSDRELEKALKLELKKVADYN